MDRREFFGIGSGMAGATVLKTAGLGLNEGPSPELAQVGSLLRTAFNEQERDGQGEGPLNVSISGEFMEDYTAGTPWLGSWAKVEVPYIARNGVAQIYSFQGRWGGVVPELVERVYGDPDPEKFPDKETVTGWTYEKRTLPDNPANQKPSFEPPQAFVITDVDYRRRDPILLPEGQHRPDLLFVYRDASLFSFPLGEDGSLGEINYQFTHPNQPLVQGPLPAGTQYIMEGPRGNNCFSEHAGFPWGCNNGPGLRDVRTMAYYPIDVHNLFTQQNGAFIRIFPLTCTKPGEYSCVALEITGAVTYLHMTLDGGTFRVDNEPLVMGYTPSHIMGVCEDAEVARVLLFAMPMISEVNLRHFDQVKPEEEILAPAPINEFQMPEYPGGTTFEVKCRVNPATGQPEIFLLVQDPLTREDGSHPDPMTELWSTSLCGTGWEPMTLVDRGLRTVVMAAAPVPTLFIQRPRTGYEYWFRDEGGDWDTTHLRIELGDGAMLESAGYRVGITLKRQQVTVSSGEILITASVATTAVIHGRHGTIGVHRPWQAACDSTGTLWVTILLEDRTAFPQLLLQSTLFPDRLVLDLNHRIEGFLSNVSEQQLLEAHDPRHCTEEKTDGCSASDITIGIDPASGTRPITDPEKAGKAAGIIRETLNAAYKPAVLSKNTGAQVTVESKIPWGWLPLSANLQALHPVMDPDKAPSWRVFHKDGVAHLERVSRAEARARMAELEAMHPSYGGAGYFGFFDFVTDAFDAIGDIAKSVYDGACKLAEAVVDGLNITVTLVIDGLTWVYKAVMDTIDMVMDAIDFVLEYAGMLLGMAVGWLLEQLGFLFDWKAIKQRRDQLQDFLKRNLRPAINKLGNPVNGAAALKRNLASVKGQALALLNSVRSSPVDQRAFANAPGESSELSTMSFINGISVLPELTWLLDKLQAVFPKASGGLGFPDVPGLDSAAGAFAAALVKAGDAISGTLQDAAKLFDDWLIKGKLFTAEAFDPIIDLLIKLIGRVIDIFSTAIDSGAQILQALMSSAENVLNSFNSTLSVPAFFRGFYKGLSGNDCSAIDVVCLLAAIPSYAEATESPNNSAFNEFGFPRAFPASLAAGRSPQQAGKLQYASFGGTLRSPLAHFEPEAGLGMGKGSGPSMSDARIVAVQFAVIGTIMAGLNTGFMAGSTPGDSIDKVADLFSYGNIVATVGFLVSSLVDEHPWVLVGTSGFIGVAAIVVGLYYKFGKNNRVMDAAWDAARARVSDNMSWFLMYAAAVNFYFAIAELATKSYDEGVSGMISMVEFLFSIYIRETRKKKPFGPYVALGFGTAMSAMNSTKTVLYALRPISG